MSERVYVVCQNDIPIAVFNNEAASVAFKEAKQREYLGWRGQLVGGGNVYFHSHTFEIDKEPTP